MIIELNNITKSFSNKKLVIDNLTIKEEISSLAIIGPSGGGKSTLLRIIGGLINPTSGDVIIDGETINYSEKKLIEYRRKIGFVFQSKGLFSHLTGLENITLPLVKVHNYSMTEANKIANQLLNRFGLRHDKNKYPSELSGGQQQRISIARAIAKKPKLLLLDEPTSALDPELTSEVLDVIDDLKNDNLNIILVTHEMGFAKNACEKVMFLANGKLVEFGNSKELFTKPNTKELSNFLNKVLEWNV